MLVVTSFWFQTGLKKLSITRRHCYNEEFTVWWFHNHEEQEVACCFDSSRMLQQAPVEPLNLNYT